MPAVTAPASALSDRQLLPGLMVPWFPTLARELMYPGTHTPVSASSPMSGNKPVAQGLWPGGGWKLAPLPLAPAGGFQSPRGVQVRTASSSSPGKRARGAPGEASLPLPHWPGGLAGPPPCRGPCSSQPEGHKHHAVTLGGTALPLCASRETWTPDLLDKPRIPWPESGEVWTLKVQEGSGILTSSQFWKMKAPRI